MIDTTGIKQTVSIADLAAQHTELRKESTAELAGPCPKCGGSDRLHCTASWFFCRQCHPERGDAIEFCTWLYGDSFKEACERLSGGPLPSAPAKPTFKPILKPISKPNWDTDKWFKRVEDAQTLLAKSSAGKGRAYLLGRGIGPEAWEAFGLGERSASLPGTEGAQKAPAISIPWFDRDRQLIGVRYRFLSLHSYTDASGKERTEKQTAAYGSNFKDSVFGWQALQGYQQRSVLIVCEGEINAISLWLATSGSVDVLSMGSESAQIPGDVIALAREYQHVIVWADRPDVATATGRQLGDAHLFSSPHGQDANDWLQAGKLTDLIAVMFEKWQIQADQPYAYEPVHSENYTGDLWPQFLDIVEPRERELGIDAVVMLQAILDTRKGWAIEPEDAQAARHFATQLGVILPKMKVEGA